ncbi:flagellar brake protein [Cohnella laeviribosi]|uniref:flagellar brake protein n=1 Tax=Cohnella laeviribosi TaxID=380174 RepID=UPI00035D1D7A|nr:flagellar brake domain-containing protein [Cohnella laeviribosi]
MLPKVNQTMFIQPVREQGDGDSSTLRSRLADADEHSLYIEVPLVEGTGRLYRTEIGERLRVFYFTAEGVRHQFATQVTGYREEAVKLVALQKPEPDAIARDQRRSFLRADAQLEVAIRIGERLRFVALTEDVGGGGLSFRCERKYPIAPRLKLNGWLLIPYRSGAVTHANFDAEVVRFEPAEPNHYNVMVQFTHIPDSERQKIIRYCFERQLDLRKE